MWDETFALLVSAFRQPALPAEQIEIERQRVLARSSPTSRTIPIARSTSSRTRSCSPDNPYANRAIGTKASVASLTGAQLRAHLAKLRETSRLLLVVVGDVDPAHVIEAANAAFGRPAARHVSRGRLPPRRRHRAALLTDVEQTAADELHRGDGAGPAWRSARVLPGVASRCRRCTTREFEEVRTKRNLSYAPAAYMRRDHSVAARQPLRHGGRSDHDDEGHARRGEQLRDDPIPADELERAKSTFVTTTVMAAEDAAGQAAMLAHAQLLGGDWRLLQDLPAKIHAVTAEQIQTWAKAHLTHFQTVVIGDPTKLDRKALERF